MLVVSDLTIKFIIITEATTVTLCIYKYCTHQKMMQYHRFSLCKIRMEIRTTGTKNHQKYARICSTKVRISTKGDSEICGFRILSCTVSTIFLFDCTYTSKYMTCTCTIESVFDDGTRLLTKTW